MSKCVACFRNVASFRAGHALTKYHEQRKQAKVLSRRRDQAQREIGTPSMESDCISHRVLLRVDLYVALASASRARRLDAI